MSITAQYPITRIDGHERFEKTDTVICESRLTIYLNNAPYVTLICTEQHTEELAIGHLCNEGVIHTLSDIQELRSDGDSVWICTEKTEAAAAAQGVRTVATGCGGPRSAAFRLLEQTELEPLDADIRFRFTDVKAQVDVFQTNSEIFLATGGVHSCALCASDGSLLYFMEDIGRHNAFDKVIGAALRDGVDPGQCFLITSGRVPSDMLIKAINARLSLLISRSAPTDAAIEMAHKYNVTLCGFARGSRMNVYSFPNRLI